MGRSSTGIPEDRLALYDELISSHQGIERKGKSMPYTSVNGNMFSFLAADGTLAIRLSEEDRVRLISEHGAVQTEQHGRIMKEYLNVPPDLEADDLRPWFEASVRFARGLEPKPTKRPKGR